MELSTTLFDGESCSEAESTNVVEAFVEQSKDAIENIIECLSQSSRSIKYNDTETQVLSGHTKNIMLITQEVRDQNTLTKTNENQTINKVIVEGLPDPKRLIPTLYDSSYVNQDIEGYLWYLLQPYINLMLYHSDKIDLLSMRKPSKSVLEMAYKNISHTKEGKLLFEQ